jgi:hypothetical protein
MMKLTKIAKEYIREGGKLFGSRAGRVSTAEMNSIFNEIKYKISGYFSKISLSRALQSKADHGDIDIVCEPSPNNTNMNLSIKNCLGPDKVRDYSKNGNIYSVLYHSDDFNKDVHVDFIVASGEAYDPQLNYLDFNDLSGMLGVLARRLGYFYSSEGFFKLYIDKAKRHHKILITKNLRDGLKIMGYGKVLDTYAEISNPEDIIRFVSSSPLFDSQDYGGQDFNHSDRKRVRAGRPTADYIRQGLINLNISRKTDNFEYYLKTLFPEKYAATQEKIKELETKVVAVKKYTGEWILNNFNIKPGPIITDIKNYWKELFGDKIDDLPEATMLNITQKYLNSHD